MIWILRPFSKSESGDRPSSRNHADFRTHLSGGENGRPTPTRDQHTDDKHLPGRGILFGNRPQCLKNARVSISISAFVIFTPREPRNILSIRYFARVASFVPYRCHERSQEQCRSRVVSPARCVALLQDLESPQQLAFFQAGGLQKQTSGTPTRPSMPTRPLAQLLGDGGVARLCCRRRQLHSTLAPANAVELPQENCITRACAA
jgi:hypothetical protein